MNTFSIKEKKSAKVRKNGLDILVGQYFTGTILPRTKTTTNSKDHTGLFVRTFNGIVDIIDPSKTWSFGEGREYVLDVDNYEVVEVDVVARKI
jgi:hypothetical protein